MPRKKRPSMSSKKKGKQRGSQTNPEADTKHPSSFPIASDVNLTEPNISIECADAFAALFSADYPPKIKLDNYMHSLPHKYQTIANEAVTNCVISGDTGYLVLQGDETSAIKRLQLAQQRFLDALSSAMKFPDVFLKTQGVLKTERGKKGSQSHRRLLCKVSLSLALARLAFLDAKGSIAWAKAAISADPTYYQSYANYAHGLLHEHRYEESLENFKKALLLANPEDNFDPKPESIINNLECIVSNEPKSKKWKSAVREVRELSRSIAISNYCDKKCPKKSCTLCFWPAEERDTNCSKCLTVYYCHQYCQFAHWPEHKYNCIVTKQRDQNELEPIYPHPNYPKNEWLSNDEYNKFQETAQKSGCHVIQLAAFQSIKALKRALMVEKNAMKIINSHHLHFYPIHYAAQRAEPFTAVEICRILIKHGAYPNVYNGNNHHVLDVCRSEAK